MGAVLQFQYALESITCVQCGIEFAMPTQYLRGLRDDHRNFHCPAGHVQHFKGQTEVERLQKEVEKKDKELEYRQRRIDNLAKMHKDSEHRASALKGVITRTKKRIANGVCPCCKRSFDQLARHMKTQHPDYASTD